jgi:hypothetical protein
VLSKPDCKEKNQIMTIKVIEILRRVSRLTTPSAVFVVMERTWLYWNTPALLPYSSSVQQATQGQSNQPWHKHLQVSFWDHRHVPLVALPMSPKAGIFAVILADLSMAVMGVGASRDLLAQKAHASRNAELLAASRDHNSVDALTDRGLQLKVPT